jgi:serine protease Do
MSTIAWGDPDKIQVGDWALSIGKGLRSGTMAALGIISARAPGNFRDLIRTDLQISKNSAGGPLLNAAGEVIGVVLPPAGNAEFASAISSQTARFVADQLMQTGRVERSYLGVDLQVITPPLAQALGLADTRGALVASVEPDSPAAKGGVEVGDVITRFRNTDISSPSELSRAVASEKPSSQVQLNVVRQGTSREVVVIVEARRTGGAKAPETVEAPGKKLGLVLAGLNEATRRQLGGEASGGAMVQRVETGSPAAENGIEVGDVILSANTRDVKGPSDVAAEWSRAQAEKKPILLRIYRNGRVMFVAVPS